MSQAPAHPVRRAATGEAGLRPRLAVEGIVKKFSGTRVLDDVSFEILPGEVHALLGHNGSGKSTLIKILANYYTPDGGAVTVDGQSLSFSGPGDSARLGLRFVHQDLGLVDTCSVLDSMFLGRSFPTRFGVISWSKARESARRSLSRVGLQHLDLDSSIEELTPSQKTGVAIARALNSDASAADDSAAVLVLDEPTATLPAAEVENLLRIVDQVAAAGTAVLYVTHRLDEVFQIADRLTVLRDGVNVATRPVAEMTKDDLIVTMVGYSIEKAERTDAARERLPELLRVEGVRAGAVRDATFTLHEGEILGLAGLTGSGREEALGLIFGAHQRERGKVVLSGTELRANDPAASIGRGIAYLPAERKTHGSILTLTASDNCSVTDVRRFFKRGLLRRSLEEKEVSTWFERLQVKPAGAQSLAFGALSGGNQQKVLFAKWLRCRPSVLLFDEPTQGVDVGAQRELHELIREVAGEGTGAVVSSSDLAELETICDRVLVFRNGEVVAELTGDQIQEHEIAQWCLGRDLHVPEHVSHISEELTKDAS